MKKSIFNSYGVEHMTIKIYTQDSFLFFQRKNCLGYMLYTLPNAMFVLEGIDLVDKQYLHGLYLLGLLFFESQKDISSELGLERERVCVCV